MIINMNGAKAPETPSPVLQEKTVTPETLPTVIGADEGYDGLSQVTVNPDAQLKAENIRSGKTIFGVAGAFTGEVSYTDDLDPAQWTSWEAISYGTLRSYISTYNSAPDKVDENLVRITDTPTKGEVNPLGQKVLYKSYGNKKYMFADDQTEGFSVSNYPPSVTNYYWYHFSYTMSGTKNISFKYGKGYTHIAGKFLVYPQIRGYSSETSSTQLTPMWPQTFPTLVIDVDTSLEVDGLGNVYFTVDIPETLFDAYAYYYSELISLEFRPYFHPLNVVIS